MNIKRIIRKLPSFIVRHKLIKALLFVSPKSSVQIINFNRSAKLVADISDPNPRNCLITESFEPEFFEIAKPLLAEGGIFFDVGANFGFCSFGLIGCLPDQNVDYHLFEANSTICRFLLQSAVLHPGHKIKINNCCASDTRGVSKLKIVNGRTGVSYICDEGDCEVTNLVLDEYIEENSIQKIKLMKMDIEGWEPFALKGCYNSFSKGMVDALYVEVSSAHLNRNGFQPRDCFELLIQTGFHLFYCKASDFESGILGKKSFELNINGYSLILAKLESESFPHEHQTDIIAIHQNSDFGKLMQT